MFGGKYNFPYINILQFNLAIFPVTYTCLTVRAFHGSMDS